MYRYSVPVLLNCPKTIFKLQKSISRNQLVPIGGQVYQRCKLYYQWEKFASLNSRIQVNCTVQCTVRVHILLSYGYTKLEIPVLVRSLKLKQLGPRLTLGWVTIQGLDVDVVATNVVKAQKWRNGASIYSTVHWVQYASGAKQIISSFSRRPIMMTGHDSRPPLSQVKAK